MKSTLIFYLSVISIFLFACSSGNDDAAGEKNENKTEAETAFKTVSIGGYTITTTNYDGLKYRNGDPIPLVNSAEEWEAYVRKMEGCAAYVNFDASSPYGIVYNGYAITDNRGFAPKGYHVPTNEEWMKIWKSVGDEKSALRPMQSTQYWAKPGSNTSGFNAIPSGYFVKKWESVGSLTNFWSSTPTNPEIDKIYLYHFDIYDHSVTTWYDHSMFGMSVRLIKD